MVSTSGMNRHAGWFVDDDHVIIFMDDGDGLGGNGRFVSVQGVGDNISITDNEINCLGSFTIHHYVASLNRVFLRRYGQLWHGLSILRVQYIHNILSACP